MEYHEFASIVYRKNRCLKLAALCHVSGCWHSCWTLGIISTLRKFTLFYFYDFRCWLRGCDAEMCIALQAQSVNNNRVVVCVCRPYYASRKSFIPFRAFDTTDRSILISRVSS